jgi:hypothetical protein
VFPNPEDRPWAATRRQEQTPGTPLRRRQNRQTPRDSQGHRQAWQVLVDEEQAEFLFLNLLLYWSGPVSALRACLPFGERSP